MISMVRKGKLKQIIKESWKEFGLNWKEFWKMLISGFIGGFIAIWISQRFANIANLGPVEFTIILFISIIALITPAFIMVIFIKYITNKNKKK